METETYKNAKLILERFDPDSKKKLVSTLSTNECITYANIYVPVWFSLKELEAQPSGPPATPRQGQGVQLNLLSPLKLTPNVDLSLSGFIFHY